MGDYDTDNPLVDGFGFKPGINTFAQNGIQTANSIAMDPAEPEAYSGSPSKLYTVVFLIVAMVIFGLPLFF